MFTKRDYINIAIYNACLITAVLAGVYLYIFRTVG